MHESPFQSLLDLYRAIPVANKTSVFVVSFNTSPKCNRLVQRSRMIDDQIYSRIHMGLVASYKVCFLSRQMLAFLCNITIMFLQLMCFRTLYFFILRKICKISYNLFDWFYVVLFPIRVYFTHKTDITCTKKCYRPFSCNYIL